MYVVLLTYTAPLQEIDYVLPDHTDWLARQFEHNHLLASGRRDMHLGEVMIARPMPRLKLDAFLAADPLVLNHLAHYEVVEFTATRTSHELRLLNEAMPH
ncbi:YciI family protein [Saccharomonospora sp. NPDC046836]|uniref:YciI family protein n=1 Tax=Saccharomonospora sp. NPDC046836 TaxID=3156921 RepID=UPI0033FE6262